MPPQLIIDIEGHKINIDLFKIEPKAQGAIKKTFNQYFNIINDMLYDLVGEKIEIKTEFYCR
tara:strand:- start:1254 stop:1439 length:186 start_codon:yes stop_codon:yes gene_type:complete